MAKLSAKHTAPNDDGFALPLVLAVILSLAVSLSIISAQTNSVRNRAEVYLGDVDRKVTMYSVQQEIAYRALLEQHGRDIVDVFAGTFTYIGMPPADEWSVNGKDRHWEGVYTEISPRPVDSSEIVVKIQEAAGLFDLNYLREEYLIYIAGLFDIPFASRRMAIREYSELIESEKYDETIRQSESKGLSFAYQICSLPRWSESRMCASPLAFGKRFIAGPSLLPNARVLSPTIRGLFLEDSNEDISQLELIHAWGEFQREHDFRDLTDESNETSGFYIVSMTAADLSYAQQFKLSLIKRNGIRPYAISDIWIGPKEDAFASSNDHLE